MKLYEITQELMPLMQQYQDSMTQEELDAVERQLNDFTLSFQEKALNIGHVCLNIDSDIEALKKEIKRLQDMKVQRENQIKWLKNYLKMHMEATNNLRIDSPTVGIRIVKNPPKVVIDDETKIPQKYFRIIPETKEVDKKSILAEIKEGIGVDGAHVEQETRLDVK